MGLDGCADTKVGNQFVQGLSGGQKKRLSVAVALVKKPSLLFLDEPTSGLDAASAASVMNYIKQLAVDLNIIIVTTIHQPYSYIYFQFTELWYVNFDRLYLHICNLYISNFYVVLSCVMFSGALESQRLYSCTTSYSSTSIRHNIA